MNKRWLCRSGKLLFAVLITTFFMSFISQNNKRIVLSGFAQGTTWQIVYYSSDSSILKHQIDSIFSEIDQSMSLYKPESLINKFNNSDEGVKVDDHFKEVIRKSLEINKTTCGAFDVTIKPLVQAWGFGVEKTKEQPSKQLIQSLLSCTGSDKIRLSKDSLIKSKGCIQIDLNGIAQGYTVDVISFFLEKKGVFNYLVEVGGELRVKGKKSEGKLFQVGIESPDGDAVSYKKIIILKEGAITTSGNYRNFKFSGNKKISHLIDTKSGFPIDNEMISVSVWAKDAITADGYDNAFMNMGVKKSIAFLKNRKDIEAYFIYIDENGSVADSATTGFNKLFKEDLN